MAPTALPGTSSTAFTSAAAARRAARREANLQKGKMPAKHERPATGSNPESEESEDAEDDEEEEEEPEEDNKSQVRIHSPPHLSPWHGAPAGLLPCHEHRSVE